MSSAPLSIALESSEAKRLQDLVQVELARRTWSEGEDDVVMSEYILVMVANRKMPSQIAAELRDLIGEGDETAADVDDFVKWMWRTGEEITGQRRQGEAPPVEERLEGARQESAHMHRRSASPEERHSGPPSEGKREQRRGAQSDRWSANEGHRDVPRRELFATSEQQNSSMASGSMQEDTRQQSDRRGARAQRHPAQGNQELFLRSLRQVHQTTDASTSSAQLQPQQRSSLSIFARAGVPNPRAAEFVPQNSVFTGAAVTGNDSLLSRLDPMLPINAPAPSEGATYVPEEYPTQPKQTSLCRWGVKCTAPMCVYSHPSPSAVAFARQTGNEPLVLRQEPCHYQKDCSRAECEFSHVSPAVKFVLAKADRAATLAFGGGSASLPQKNPASYTATTVDAAEGPPKSKLDMALGQGGRDTSGTPCRFGVACHRSDCHFQHPAQRATHISERLKTFSTDAEESEMEVIIPVA